MGKFNQKSIVSFWALLFFVFAAQSQTIRMSEDVPTSLLNETEIFLAVKSKCRASVTSYRCRGGIIFDEKKLAPWKKDRDHQNYYEYAGPVEPDFISAHEKLKINFLKRACVHDGLAAYTMRDIITCTEKGQKKQIVFQVGKKGRGYELVCDAAGSEAWIRMNFAKADWEEAPKMPYYYIAKNVKPENIERLSESIRLSVGDPPIGCRKMICKQNTGLGIPDACEHDTEGK